MKGKLKNVEETYPASAILDSHAILRETRIKPFVEKLHDVLAGATDQSK